MRFKRLKNITNSVEKKQAPYYVREYLELLCKNHLAKKPLTEPLFDTQDSLTDVIAKTYSDMSSLNQSSVSRSLKDLLPLDLEDGYGNYYRIVRTGKGYFLRLRCEANEMVPLYNAPNIFVKDSAFKLTDYTLVFNVIQDKARVNAFISLIDANISEDLLWGVSHQGSYLYLMFNKGYKGWEGYYKSFFNYFDGRKSHLGEDIVYRQIKKAKSEAQKNVCSNRPSLF